MAVRKNPKALLLVLAIVFLLYGCSSSHYADTTTSIENPGVDTMEQSLQTDDKQIVIGLALATLTEERWQHEKDFFEAEAKLNGARVITFDAKNNEESQMAQVEDLIKQKIDVLVIVAVNAKTASSIVAAAKKVGIPVLAYSRMINNADLDAFIGFDATALGETIAQAAIQRVPEGKYMIINGSPLDNNAKFQRTGYYNILQPFIDSGKIQVIYEQWCDGWEPERALTAVGKGLDESGNMVDAIIVSNDGMAGGVIQALTDRKLDGKVFVSGTDGDQAALKRIGEGKQTLTLFFPQKEFAEEAARAAISLANNMIPADATGKSFNDLKFVPTIFARSILVDKNNLNDILESELQKAEGVNQITPSVKKPG